MLHGRCQNRERKQIISSPFTELYDRHCREIVGDPRVAFHAQKHIQMSRLRDMQYQGLMNMLSLGVLAHNFWLVRQSHWSG
jgi:hypothetical protein